MPKAKKCPRNAVARGSREARLHCGEERWIGIGWIGPMIGVVVFTLCESEENNTSVLRILSARKASKKEVALFEQEIKN